ASAPDGAVILEPARGGTPRTREASGGGPGGPGVRAARLRAILCRSERPSMPLWRPALATALALAFLAGRASAQDTVGEFPAVQVPEGNPLTPEKVRLGQALFYEEQVSSDDTMACGTCHRPEAGGSDPRPRGRNPGADGRLQTADDEFGVYGMFFQDG